MSGFIFSPWLVNFTTSDDRNHTLPLRAVSREESNHSGFSKGQTNTNMAVCIEPHMPTHTYACDCQNPEEMNITQAHTCIHVSALQDTSTTLPYVTSHSYLFVQCNAVKDDLYLPLTSSLKV